MNKTPWDGYPLTIVRTRYGGTYEEGKYAAFPLYESSVNELDYDGGDLVCAEWWAEPTVPVGVGETPNDALEDLTTKLQTVDAFRIWNTFAAESEPIVVYDETYRFLNTEAGRQVMDLGRSMGLPGVTSLERPVSDPEAST